MGFTNRQRLFVEEYLTCWNATEAARRAGFAYPNNNAKRLMLNNGVQELIKQRLSEKAMSADEVWTRLAEHARGDIGEFMDIESMSFDLDLAKAKDKNLTHLIKKVKQRTITTMKGEEETETNIIEIELYDAQAALVQLGRKHGLFIDKTDITSGGEKLSVPDERYDRAISSLADALRKSLPGADVQPESPVDATEQSPVASPPQQGG